METRPKETIVRQRKSSDEPINATLVDVDGEAKLLMTHHGSRVLGLRVFVLWLARLRHGCPRRGRDPALPLCLLAQSSSRGFIYRHPLMDSLCVFSGRTPIGDDRALALSSSSESYTCHGANLTVNLTFSLTPHGNEFALRGR